MVYFETDRLPLKIERYFRIFNLPTESGRRRNILRYIRICEFCNSEIEDEHHVVLIYPFY